MRRALLTLAISFLALLSPISPRNVLAADQTSSTPAPENLTMALAGTQKPILATGWINQSRIDLRFSATVTSGPLTPQVEVRPSSVPLTGQPTFEGAPLTTSGRAVVTARGLRDDRTYHWAARLVDASGAASDWVAFGGLASASDDFGVDLTAPARPVIASSTNPDESQWYNTTAEQVSWRSRDGESGIAGYTYRLEQQTPHVIPPGAVTTAHAARLTNLSDGVWFLAMRAEDRAGNWSPTATFRLQLDRQQPKIFWLSAKRIAFNPYRGSTTVQFKVSKDVRARLSLYRVGSKEPVTVYSYPMLRAGQVTSITWTGMTKRGKPMPKGYYFFSAELTDHANNAIRANVGALVLQPLLGVRSPAGPTVYPDGGKRIIVSLSQETLYAYDGDRLALRTLVTTGNPSLPTPTGHFTIMQKLHPFEFISPWPQGSPYWYAPSWTQYAMLFRDGGYYLHDAPWRSAFGPGTNGPGQPGTNYGGTHGCVNIPPDAMTFLWNWSPVGTVVDVVP